MDANHRFKIAVLGSSTVQENSPAAEHASHIGRLVASRGGVLLTGGCPGFPLAAVQGANAERGLTVGISPAAGREEHELGYSYPLDSRVMIYTGMGKKGRNVILIRSADACVFVGGGMGTLNEFTIAFDELGTQCAIGILTGSGGLSDELSRLVALTGRSSRAYLVAEADPERLIEAIFEHLDRASS